MRTLIVREQIKWSAPDAEMSDLLATARRVARSPDDLATLAGGDVRLPQ